MRFLMILVVAAFVAMGAARAGPDDTATVPECMISNAWVDPVSRKPLSGVDVLADAAAGGMVLLGESHDNADHHRWQLQTIAALQARGGPMMLSFEMFPRRVQPLLDEWVAGGLSEDEFLEAVEWDRVWGFDPTLYMPLFHFARINRLPMVALNVERSRIPAVREGGWDAVPEAIREGVSDPAPPELAYWESLSEVYLEHLEMRDQEADPIGLERFIQAQLTWDRAMAEALAAAIGEAILVVGIIGNGHLENGWGVPFQLAALGVADVTVLLPWDRGRDCDDLTGARADAVFVLDLPVIDQAGIDLAEAPWRPRLGVMLKTVEGALAVLEVVSGSVAENAGIEAGDVIVTAAGLAMAAPDDLVAVIGRQAPGTWLPLSLDRDGATMDVIAKFPVAP